MEPFDLWLDPDVRVLVERHGQPLERYAVMLQVLRDGEWRTIRLFDNAHGGHDMHRYDRYEKQDAERFFEGQPREALPAAIMHLKEHWQAIVESWEHEEETAE
jgi:hypothetical protein